MYLNVHVTHEETTWLVSATRADIVSEADDCDSGAAETRSFSLA